jgi:hypothetical protein
MRIIRQSIDLDVSVGIMEEAGHLHVGLHRISSGCREDLVSAAAAVVVSKDDLPPRVDLSSELPAALAASLALHS